MFVTHTSKSTLETSHIIITNWVLLMAKSSTTYRGSSMTTAPFCTLAPGATDSLVDEGGVGETDGGSGLGGRTDCNSDNRSSTRAVTLIK